MERTRKVTEDELTLVKQIRRGKHEVMQVLVDYVVANDRPAKDRLLNIWNLHLKKVEELEKIPLERFVGTWTRHEFIAERNRCTATDIKILYFRCRLEKPAPSKEEMVEARIARYQEALGGLARTINALEKKRTKLVRKIAANKRLLNKSDSPAKEGSHAGNSADPQGDD